MADSNANEWVDLISNQDVASFSLAIQNFIARNKYDKSAINVKFGFNDTSGSNLLNYCVEKSDTKMVTALCEQIENLNNDDFFADNPKLRQKIYKTALLSAVELDKISIAQRLVEYLTTKNLVTSADINNNTQKWVADYLQKKLNNLPKILGQYNGDNLDDILKQLSLYSLDAYKEIIAKRPALFYAASHPDNQILQLLFSHYNDLLNFKYNDCNFITYTLLNSENQNLCLQLLQDFSSQLNNSDTPYVKKKELIEKIFELKTSLYEKEQIIAQLYNTRIFERLNVEQEEELLAIANKNVSRNLALAIYLVSKKDKFSKKQVAKFNPLLKEFLTNKYNKKFINTVLFANDNFGFDPDLLVKVINKEKAPQFDNIFTCLWFKTKEHNLSQEEFKAKFETSIYPELVKNTKEQAKHKFLNRLVFFGTLSLCAFSIATISLPKVHASMYFLTIPPFVANFVLPYLIPFAVICGLAMLATCAFMLLFKEPIENTMLVDKDDITQTTVPKKQWLIFKERTSPVIINSGLQAQPIASNDERVTIAGKRQVLLSVVKTTLTSP